MLINGFKWKSYYSFVALRILCFTAGQMSFIYKYAFPVCAFVYEAKFFSYFLLIIKLLKHFSFNELQGGLQEIHSNHDCHSLPSSELQEKKSAVCTLSQISDWFW